MLKGHLKPTPPRCPNSEKCGWAQPVVPLSQSQRLRACSTIWRERSDSYRFSKPLKIQIVERARALIADEEHWCCRHFGEDANGSPVSPTSASAITWCGLGAVIAAAYELTHDLDAAHQLGHEALRPRYGAATVIHVHDVRGHAALLALFDEVIARRVKACPATRSEPQAKHRRQRQSLTPL
jgi:hypothetical protein